MSGPAKSAMNRHFLRAVSLWPTEALRPDLQFRDLLSKRAAAQVGSTAGGGKAAAAEEAQLWQVNAVYSLLDNRYMTRYRIKGQLMHPKSNPTHYADLMTEIDEAPKRTWLGRIGKRLGGMFRLQ